MGHVSTASHKVTGSEAPHVWRFVKRKNMHMADPNFLHAIESNFADSPHDDDIIALVKHYLSSNTLSQPPFVFVPASRFGALQASGPGLAARKVLSERQVKEFCRTAEAVGARPWSLDRAQAYLEALVENNEKGSSSTWILPDISWVLNPPVRCHGSLDLRSLFDAEEVSAQLNPSKISARPTAKRRTSKVPDPEHVVAAAAVESSPVQGGKEAGKGGSGQEEEGQKGGGRGRSRGRGGRGGRARGGGRGGGRGGASPVRVSRARGRGGRGGRGGVKKFKNEK